MNSLTHWKTKPAHVWGTATWRNIADSVLPVVDKKHVARRARRTGDRWLDVAAGTWAVALPAACAGADVGVERHRRDGTVGVPRPYLLLVGRRRAWGRR
jgi:hypothetical protein